MKWRQHITRPREGKAVSSYKLRGRALTTATASMHTLTTSSYPYSSHLTSGDCDDSCPTICLLDSSVLVVLVNYFVSLSL
jgi:hypothetical protein